MKQFHPYLVGTTFGVRFLTENGFKLDLLPGKNSETKMSKINSRKSYFESRKSSILEQRSRGLANIFGHNPFTGFKVGRRPNNSTNIKYLVRFLPPKNQCRRKRRIIVRYVLKKSLMRNFQHHWRCVNVDGPELKFHLTIFTRKPWPAKNRPKKIMMVRKTWTL